MSTEGERDRETHRETQRESDRIDILKVRRERMLDCFLVTDTLVNKKK